jgi:selenocysteine lyase/cysteine desulfurase
MRAPIPLPLRHPSEVVDALFAHASERTRAVYVSHRLVCEARHDLCELLGTQPIAPDSMIAQMAAVRLPRPMADLSERLFTRHRIEIPLGRGHDFLRLSVAGYTTRDEIDRLLAALVRELDAEHGQRDE